MLLAISIAMAIVAMNRAISFRSNFILLIPPQISQTRAARASRSTPV
jgi:hypothetical protein